MCAIVDANVAHEVFGENAPAAGVRFLNWISNGNGRLAVGGLLMSELASSSSGFRAWAVQAQLSGRMRVANKSEVENKTAALSEAGACKSNDHHVIALAQVSGARLLYTNDRDLQDDFRDERLIDNPRGSVYSTLRTKRFAKSHRDLIGGRRSFCASA